MKILWFTWKDQKNPAAGGAELVNEELARRLVEDGHEIIFLVAGFKGCEKEETIKGYKIIRIGNRWSIYWQAYKYFKKYLKNWPDLIIEEINTIPFFTQFYSKKKRILIFYQLCREIWFYQLFFPLNLIGYLLEPIYLWILSKNKVITISNSTKNDLIKYGFAEIGIITVGTALKLASSLKAMKKYSDLTILSLGTIRPMKRTIDQIKAFEIAKKTIPDLKLKIAGLGNGHYFNKFKKIIDRSIYKNDIEYLGNVNLNKKIELMQKSHLILVTSIKEGWGLIVTEANSQGTPAIVYNVDGLRDAVKNNSTGIICQQNNPDNLAKNVVKLLNNKEKYQNLRINAWRQSKEINFDVCYKNFIKIISN